jgi:hypothetical protein
MNHFGSFAPNRLIENVDEITAEQPALRETFGFPSFSHKSLCKVVRITGPRAHPFRTNVEQMDVLARRICNAATNASATLDK